MEKSQSIIGLCKALATFHSNVQKIKKDSKNPFFKSSYASLSNILDTISEPMNSAGLIISQHPVGNDTLITMLLHAETGEYLQSEYNIHPVKTDPQSIGSAITYARRYAIGAILNLNIDDDDDGNAATHQQQPKPKETKAAPAKTVSDNDQILFSIDQAKNLIDLTNIYHRNVEYISAHPEVLAAFTAKKKSLPKTA